MLNLPHPFCVFKRIRAGMRRLEHTTCASRVVGLILMMLAPFPVAGSEISRGEALVKANCARCHAMVGRPEPPPGRAAVPDFVAAPSPSGLGGGACRRHRDRPPGHAGIHGQPGPDQRDHRLYRQPQGKMSAASVTALRPWLEARSDALRESLRTARDGGAVRTGRD